MNWLTRLLANPQRTKDDDRRARETDKALTIAEDFANELRRDIDQRKRETDLAQALLRARDGGGAPT